MENEFLPYRHTGIILQGVLTLLCTVFGGYYFFLATQEPSGLDFLMNMMIALVVFTPLPLLAYRLYALVNGLYILRRDGLMIRWGLRRENIPLREIDWIRPANELGFRLPLPWLRWPGAVIGSRKLSELGQVEFIASDTSHMLLVATPDKVFAISPEETKSFMALFQQINELGSLAPLEPQSFYPKFLLGMVWEDQRARWLILAGFAVALALLGLVGMTIPGRETIAWIGPDPIAPAERLLLLPILAGIIWLFNLVAGFFLYRRGGDLQIAAYFLWGNSTLVGLLLLIGSLWLIF